MALTRDAESATNRRLEQVRDSYERNMVSLVQDARWLTTIVLAAIAGIATYRTSGVNSSGLGPAYAILIVLFGFSLSSFVLSAIRARYEQATFAEKFHAALVAVSSEMSRLGSNDTISPEAGTEQLIRFREGKIAELPTSLRLSAKSEQTGLGILALASVLAALMIFFSELVVSILER